MAFKRLPLKRVLCPRAVAVLQLRRDWGPLLEFGKGKAMYFSKVSVLSSLLTLEIGTCKVLLKELNSISVFCRWQPGGPILFSQRNSSKEKRRCESWIAK